MVGVPAVGVMVEWGLTRDWSVVLVDRVRLYSPVLVFTFTVLWAVAKAAPVGLL